MPRSTKKSINIPNPLREGLGIHLKDGTLDYPSENAAWIGLVRFQMLSGETHTISSAIARMHPGEQDAIDDLVLELAKLGLTRGGLFLTHLTEVALSGNGNLTPKDAAHLVTLQLLKMAKDWRRNPKEVIECLIMEIMSKNDGL